MYNDLFSIGGLTVHGYGLCIGIGIAAALLLIWRRAEERKFDVQSVNTLILLILAAGFAGAKLFFVFAHWNEFCADPLGTLGSEGFVVYGGIVCGLGAAYLYCRKRSLPFLRWVDCFIPCVALAQGLRAHRVLSRRVLLRQTDGVLSRRHIPGGAAWLRQGSRSGRCSSFRRRAISCSPERCCFWKRSAAATDFSPERIFFCTASAGF